MAVVAAGLLFEAGLDERGVCATTSIDTKLVIRKILIIIINFFITLYFLGLKVTGKTAFLPYCLMLHHNFLIGMPRAALHRQYVKAFGEAGNRDFYQVLLPVFLRKHSFPHHII